MQNHKVVLLFFAFILLGFAGWLYVRVDNEEQTSRKQSIASPNIFAKDITIVNYDEKGNLTSRYNIAKVYHYPDKNSRFEKPHLIIYKNDAPPWTIDAKHGIAKNGKEVITFWQNVQIFQQKTATQKETKITTNRIHYYPEKNIAETEELITLQQPGLTVSAVGLHADLAKQQFNLLSKVEGHYEKMA